jgi:signal transduction histidine kinase
MTQKTSKTALYRNYLKSSSFQMALFFTILCGAAVLSLGYFNHYFNKGHFIQGTEQLIDSDIRHARLINDTNLIIKTIDTEKRIFLLTDKNKNKLGGNIESFPEQVSLLTEGIVTINEGKKKYAAKIHTFPDNRLLLIGVDITRISNDYNFMSLLSILSIVFMFIVIATSYLISHFVVKRTNDIAATAQTIMRTGDLSKRIEVDSRWDDLSNMAETLNSLLARIDDLMIGIRRVSDNIAHDLRTPLTRLRNDLEELKEGKNISHEEVIAEADHLLNTFNALLRISRIETEKQKSQFQKIAIHSIVQDAVELYEALAEDKKIMLKANLEEINFIGDQNLFFQAVANLLDNAIKFTPQNGTIEINLKGVKEFFSLSIKDTGSGVPEDQTDKIFDRFYRADTSRNKSGNGLGLSLVAAVVNLHDGKIDVKNTEPGLEVTLTFENKTQ